jgi:membrane-associated protease RseP (regulator of RpoE activity)
MRDLIPELMDPAQVNKVNVPFKLKEARTTAPPAKVTAAVVRDDTGAAIESIAGRKPRDIIDAYSILLSLKDNESIDVVYAGGEQEQLKTQPTPTPDAIVQARQRLGIVVEELTPLSAQKYRMLDEDGMLITEVLRDGVGARAGLQPGDVIVQLGRYPVTSLKRFSSLMQYLPQSGRVRIGVSRGGQRGFGVLEL